LVQVSVIDDADVDVAERPVGAAGTVGPVDVGIVSGGVVVPVPLSDAPPQAERHRSQIKVEVKGNRTALERRIGVLGSSMVTGQQA
jgi:hypothetical protein